MNISSVETELLHLQALIARWKEQKYTPAIEREIALDRLRKLYQELLDLKCEDPHTSAPTEEIAPAPQPADQSSTDHDTTTQCEQATDCNQQFADGHTESKIEEMSQVIDQMNPVVEPEITDYQPTELEIETEIEIELEPEPQTIEQNISQDEAQRHRFIHDLFCNDETFYIGEMRKIEALGSFDDVLIYIGQKYAWTPDNTTAEEFVSWISTRFDF